MSTKLTQLHINIVVTCINISVASFSIIIVLLILPFVNTGSGYILNSNTLKNKLVTFGTESIISSNLTSVPSGEG